MPRDTYSPFRGQTNTRVIHVAASISFVSLCMVLSGCGSGGYAGKGISGLSSSAIVIDAGQSFQITADDSGSSPVSWSLSGTSCTASACGTLSSSTGASVTYTAPAGIASAIKLTATAAIPGTNSSSVANITVNPDPVISGTPPAANVGIPYSATLTASGGTAPLTLSLTGSLPAGLTFDSKTGLISGTPTTSGSTNVTAQVVDSSDVPYTVKAAETIAVSSPVTPLQIAGNPPSGTVNVAYTTTLSASGGTAPYSFSLTSGSLPAGLTLAAATGVISGTPTLSGTSIFTGQVQDASGALASASFSITIAPTGQVLGLSLLPDATVGVPYNATIGVSGGVAPYTCTQTGGTLPAGLTLSAGCVGQRHTDHGGNVGDDRHRQRLQQPGCYCYRAGKHHRCQRRLVDHILAAQCNGRRGVQRNHRRSGWNRTVQLHAGWRQRCLPASRSAQAA